MLAAVNVMPVRSRVPSSVRFWKSSCWANSPPGQTCSLQTAHHWPAFATTSVRWVSRQQRSSPGTAHIE